MSTPPKKGQRSEVLRALGYVARPKRKENRDGVEQSYWTVRCRRLGETGEWGLGWFATKRLAEGAFNDWLSAHKPTGLKSGGDARVLDVLAGYDEAVETMTQFRPNTRSNRLYTSAQLRQFVTATDPSMSMARFRDVEFGAYKSWLETRGYSEQTTLNAVIGARTFFRWAEASNFVAVAPKAPKVAVPPVQHAPLFHDDVEAVIAVAAPPLNLLLWLLAETGLRITEATSRVRADIQQQDDKWVLSVAKRGAFVPKTTHSTREVPLPPDLAAALLRLTDEPEGALFPCDTKAPYAHWRVLMNKAQAKAGVTQFSFHALRRAFADRLRRSGAGVDRYIRFLGHAAVTGLRHYSTVSMDDLQESAEKARGSVRRRKAGPPPIDPNTAT
jgi:integrase